VHTFGGDLSKALKAQQTPPSGYSLEFKPIETLALLFKSHPLWNKMKAVIPHGSVWPLAPLSKDDRIKDVKEALQFENHKASEQHQDLLRKLVKDDDDRGFMLPLSLNKFAFVPGVLLAPLNIQLQKNINKCSKIIPKNRLTHEQSWKWQRAPQSTAELTQINCHVTLEKH
jgi:hypothetical protein